MNANYFLTRVAIEKWRVCALYVDGGIIYSFYDRSPFLIQIFYEIRTYVYYDFMCFNVLV